MFIKALEHCIAQLGWGGQRQTALKADIDPVYLNDILKGRKPGSEKARAAISKALGYHYEDFLKLGRELLKKGESPPPKKPPAQSSRPEDLPHEEIISRFKHKDWARRLNAMLLVIEEDPELRENAERTLRLMTKYVEAHRQKTATSSPGRKKNILPFNSKKE